jgi:hypothetical protein
MEDAARRTTTSATTRAMLCSPGNDKNVTDALRRTAALQTEVCKRRLQGAETREKRSRLTSRQVHAPTMRTGSMLRSAPPPSASLWNPARL